MTILIIFLAIIAFFIYLGRNDSPTRGYAIDAFICLIWISVNIGIFILFLYALFCLIFR